MTFKRTAAKMSKQQFWSLKRFKNPSYGFIEEIIIVKKEISYKNAKVFPLGNLIIVLVDLKCTGEIKTSICLQF